MAARRPAQDRIDPDVARQVGLDPDEPGELEPLPYTRGRAPITEHEARAVYRRHSVVRQLRRGGAGTGSPVRVPVELPAEGAVREMVALRFPPRLLSFARARAEMEGVSLTSVLEAALVAYAEGWPGEPVGFLVRPGVE